VSVCGTHLVELLEGLAPAEGRLVDKALVAVLHLKYTPAHRGVRNHRRPYEPDQTKRILAFSPAVPSETPSQTTIFLLRGHVHHFGSCTVLPDDRPRGGTHLSLEV
jgi:hypothetical protein